MSKDKIIRNIEVMSKNLVNFFSSVKKKYFKKTIKNKNLKNIKIDNLLA